MSESTPNRFMARHYLPALSCVSQFIRSCGLAKTSTLTIQIFHLFLILPYFSQFFVWHPLCFTFKIGLQVEEFLKFTLAYPAARCTKHRSTMVVVRTKQSQNHQKHCELDTQNHAGGPCTGRGQCTGHQSIYPGDRLERILVARFRTDLTADRRLRNCTGKVATDCSSACVHVNNPALNFTTTSDRVSNSVTFFCS